jgi:hypothetical protein
MSRAFPLLIALAALPLVGCEPNCAKTCKKLLSCDDIDTEVSEVEECEATCEIQQSLYDDWGEDSIERKAFGELKQCIKDNECTAIADGECYDDELYIW